MTAMITNRVVNYAITGVRFRHEDRAARLALMAITPKFKTDQLEADIVDSQLGIIKAWRARVRGLTSNGYHHTEDDDKRMAMYNCPPVGVVTRLLGQRPCRKATICPFCWCRQYVHPACVRLENFYYGHTPGEPLHNHLIEVVDQLSYAPTDGVLSRVFADFCTSRRALVDHYKPLGAVQLLSVLPPDPRDPEPRWMSRISMLGVLPGTYAIDAAKQHDPVVHTAVTHKVLAGALGRVFRYHPQILRGPIRRAAELANFLDGYNRAGRMGKTITGGSQVKGFRMLSTYGELRG